MPITLTWQSIITAGAVVAALTTIITLNEVLLGETRSLRSGATDEIRRYIP